MRWGRDESLLPCSPLKIHVPCTLPFHLLPQHLRGVPRPLLLPSKGRQVYPLNQSPKYLRSPVTSFDLFLLWALSSFFIHFS